MPRSRSTATARFACVPWHADAQRRGADGGQRRRRGARRSLPPIACVAASTLERAVAGSGPSSAFHRRRHVPSVHPRKFGSIENEIRRPRPTCSSATTEVPARLDAPRSRPSTCCVPDGNLPVAEPSPAAHPSVVVVHHPHRAPDALGERAARIERDPNQAPRHVRVRRVEHRGADPAPCRQHGAALPGDQPATAFDPLRAAPSCPSTQAPGARSSCSRRGSRARRCLAGRPP